ncbi:MAG TPA: hypothetical protein VMT60_00855, partial [Candidatus Bathyarchaeia archaeon]|nr:hypothetical protein [Candidatus Bathyarchaeia archaeon]
MRTVSIFCMLAFAAVVGIAAPASAHKIVCNAGGDHGFFRGENVKVDLDEGSIVFTNQDNDETVVITDQCALLVNGRSVPLGRHDRERVREYRDTFETIMEESKAIGLEGARIGTQGAKIGVEAAIGVLKLLAQDGDTKDLEIELDHKSEKIGRVAEKLE